MGLSRQILFERLPPQTQDLHGFFLQQTIHLEGRPIIGSMNLNVTINATPETVFAVVSDVANSPKRIDWYEKVDMLTNGPVRVGTKWRETRRMSNKLSVE